ncbi:MAG: hypothetical protein WC130_11165 [Kiritimatiellia bacterium]|jgi:lambda repressor-like predicted transcriptional regulator
MNTNHLKSSGKVVGVNAEILHRAGGQRRLSGELDGARRGVGLQVAGVNPEITGVLSPALAKARLRALGWTIRDAAAAVGLKAPMSLHRILTGEYQNRRVLREIARLGLSPRRRYERRNAVGKNN